MKDNTNNNVQHNPSEQQIEIKQDKNGSYYFSKSDGIYMSSTQNLMDAWNRHKALALIKFGIKQEEQNDG